MQSNVIDRIGFVEYSLAQMWQLLQNSSGRLRIYLHIAFMTGMMAGEILALEWSDIDFRALCGRL